jgi:two-component system, OmpR family, sensor kinase
MRVFSSTSHARLSEEGDDQEVGPETVSLKAAGRVRRRARLPALGVRTRILLGFTALLALATVASVLVARQIEVAQIDRRISDALAQESRELRRLAAGRDPATGRAFDGDVRRIFDVYLSRNSPSRNEALLTFVDGKPYRRSAPVGGYRLDRDPELVARWSALIDTDRGRVNGTPAGDVEYLAVPFLDGDRTAGVFVVAVFREGEERELGAVTLATGGVGLAILLAGSILAWRLADRILRPVRLVTRTARTISETDLERRIPVEGRDEVAELALTFNEMLGRLEQAFSTQRRFLDDAGHELRTPITIVRGHLEVMGDDPAEQRETVALVTDELDRMARLVDDLLTLAHAERLDFLDRESVALAALTDELLSKARGLGDRAWTLDARAEGVALADRHRLTQGVMQLAENAVRHTSPGDVIGLGTAASESEVRLWVRDTGPGVPTGEEQRVFERFARGRGMPRGESSGLGLSIVRAIAEAHGGRVELRSTPGEGATFAIVLPVRKVEA